MNDFKWGFLMVTIAFSIMCICVMFSSISNNRHQTKLSYCFGHSVKEHQVEMCLEAFSKEYFEEFEN